MANRNQALVSFDRGEIAQSAYFSRGLSETPDGVSRMLNCHPDKSGGVTRAAGTTFIADITNRQLPTDTTDIRQFYKVSEGIYLMLTDAYLYVLERQRDATNTITNNFAQRGSQAVNKGCQMTASIIKDKIYVLLKNNEVEFGSSDGFIFEITQTTTVKEVQVPPPKLNYYPIPGQPDPEPMPPETKTVLVTTTETNLNKIVPKLGQIYENGSVPTSENFLYGTTTGISVYGGVFYGERAIYYTDEGIVISSVGDISELRVKTPKPKLTMLDGTTTKGVQITGTSNAYRIDTGVAFATEIAVDTINIADTGTFKYFSIDTEGLIDSNPSTGDISLNIPAIQISTVIAGTKKNIAILQMSAGLGVLYGSSVPASEFTDVTNTVKQKSYSKVTILGRFTFDSNKYTFTLSADILTQTSTVLIEEPPNITASDAFYYEFSDLKGEHFVDIVQYNDSIIATTHSREFIIGNIADPTLVPTISEATHIGTAGNGVVSQQNALYFVRSDGKSVSQYAYDEATRNYKGVDINALSIHLFNTGVRSIHSWSSEYPHVWFVMNDGSVVGLVAINQIFAFYQWDIIINKDNAQVMCMSDNTGVDSYAIVKRRINSVNKVFLEQVTYAVQSSSTAEVSVDADNPIRVPAHIAKTDGSIPANLVYRYLNNAGIGELPPSEVLPDTFNYSAGIKMSLELATIPMALYGKNRTLLFRAIDCGTFTVTTNDETRDKKNTTVYDQPVNDNKYAGTPTTVTGSTELINGTQERTLYTYHKYDSLVRFLQDAPLPFNIGGILIGMKQVGLHSE